MKTAHFLPEPRFFSFTIEVVRLSALERNLVLKLEVLVEAAARRAGNVIHAAYDLADTATREKYGFGGSGFQLSCKRVEEPASPFDMEELTPLAVGDGCKVWSSREI